MEKLGLNRDQYDFLRNQLQVDQFEKLFRRVNELSATVETILVDIQTIKTFLGLP